MKKLLSLLLVLTMVFAIACAGATVSSAANDGIKLIAYCPGAGVPFQTVEKFAEIVNAADCGVVVEVHENGTLGNDAEAIESTRMGTIDVICAGTSGFTAFYEPAKVLDLPFLFSDAKQACEVMNGEVGEEIFANFPQFGLVYLGEGDNGLRHISTTNRPIHTAADVEGLKTVSRPASCIWTCGKPWAPPRSPWPCLSWPSPLPTALPRHRTTPPTT